MWSWKKSSKTVCGNKNGRQFNYSKGKSDSLNNYFPVGTHTSYSGVQSWIFQGRVDFVELEHFDKHFVKSQEKKSVFSQLLLKN